MLWLTMAVRFLRLIEEITVGHQDREWCVVVKYQKGNWLGESIDAFYVRTSVEALHMASKGPMKPGDLLRVFWAANDKQAEHAAELHDRKRQEYREFERLMAHMDSHFIDR
jgi:hypothetical protein